MNMTYCGQCLSLIYKTKIQQSKFINNIKLCCTHLTKREKSVRDFWNIILKSYVHFDKYYKEGISRSRV